jgi:hypothetical protein
MGESTGDTSKVAGDEVSVLTERQAWLELATLFKISSVYLCVRGYGLCWVICYRLHGTGAIAETVRRRMIRKVRSVRFRFGDYRWPPTLEGNQLRTSFCRRQAAKLVRSKK